MTFLNAEKVFQIFFRLHEESFDCLPLLFATTTLRNDLAED
jgi:hypothetical protein